MIKKKYNPLWVEPNIHKQIKLKASKEGKTINKFLGEMFKEQLTEKENDKKKIKFGFKW